LKLRSESGTWHEHFGEEIAISILGSNFRDADKSFFLQLLQQKANQF
jgi:hypothetical protein